MNSDETRFQTLMEGVRSGSQDAAWELIEIYGPHIQRVVSRKLDRRLRSKFDSHDFVQAVWASFFRPSSRPREFEHPKALVAYLGNMARNKVVEEMRRRFDTAKYDVTKEQPLTESDDSPPPQDVRQPTPSQVAIAREQWEHMLDGQPKHYQQIVQLRFEGSTFAEIAEELGIHERTARKVIQKMLLRTRGSSTNSRNT
jgi:RNA polymerase sigma factor (sigma-70 family)